MRGFQRSSTTERLNRLPQKQKHWNTYINCTQAQSKAQQNAHIHIQTVYTVNVCKKHYPTIVWNIQNNDSNVNTNNKSNNNAKNNVLIIVRTTIRTVDDDNTNNSTNMSIIMIPIINITIIDNDNNNPISPILNTPLKTWFSREFPHTWDRGA